LAAPSHQLRQSLAIGISERVRSDAFGKQGNDLGIECVGFGEPPGGTGEVPDRPWIDDGDRKMGAGRAAATVVSNPSVASSTIRVGAN